LKYTLVWTLTELALLSLDSTQLQNIFTHAESSYPEECCGLMLGYVDNGDKNVVELIPTENVWSGESNVDFPGDVAESSKRRRYAIAPQVMLKVQREARDKNLNIIGIYHSHPNSPAIPSECDRAYAWQEYSYIIVSVEAGKACDIKSWTLDDNHQFQEELVPCRWIRD
jgi:proteasome lid subunit RPN8/RPN11